MRSLAARELLVQLGSPATLRLGTTGAAVSIARVRLHLDAVDAVLGGGLPRGRVSEIVGPSSCGKTALLHALLASATARGEVVALVDLADAFSPPDAAAAGIDLARMLWARPASVREALRCAELLLDAGGFGVVAVDLGNIMTQGSRAWQPAGRRQGRPGDPRDRDVRRLGAGAWPRLARAAGRSATVVAVLADAPIAGTFAALGIVLRSLAQHWSRRGGGPALFDGFDTEVALVRNRLGAPERAATVRVAAA